MTPHRWPIRVYYEDVDLAGIVYYANYLRYVERARSELVREIGLDQNALRADGLVFAVAHLEARYLASGRYDDQLTVETVVKARTPARCTMGQTVLRADTVLFQADVTIICMSLDGRPRRLPAPLLAVPITEA